jgi:post-segregation antitoxin (ccd killing protein)
MSTLLHVRIPNELAERLEDQRSNRCVNVSALVRRAIERELERPDTPTSHAPVLVLKATR